MLKSSIVCFVVCFGSSELTTHAPMSDFCERYERQIITEEDVEAIRALPKRLRDRIQGNELDYLCQCQKWKNPACDSIQQ